MKPTICCTFIVERSDSPALPSPRTVTGPNTPHSRKTVDSPAIESRYTSVRTEDLQDIQRIFKDAQTNDENATPARDGKSSSKSSPRKSLIGSLFRKTINRPRPNSLRILLPDNRRRSKSMGHLLSDPSQLQKAKGEIRMTLFSQQGPDSGGYDSDASVMGDVDEPATQQEDEDSPTRGRTRLRSQDVGSVDSPQSRTLRVSSSLSLPRISLDLDTLTLRRSFSVCSNGSRPDVKGRQKLRLPQVSISSRHWKRSVMESLQISSPSMSLLPGPELAEKGPTAGCPLHSKTNLKQTDKSVSEYAPRLSLMNGSFDQPFCSSHTPIHASAHSVGTASSLENEGRLHQSNQNIAENSNRPFPAHCAEHSSGGVKLGLANLLDRSDHEKHRASTASIHLQSMRISHHLRSNSSFSSAAVTTGAATTINTRSHSPIQCVPSRSCSGPVPLPSREAHHLSKSSRSAYPSEILPERPVNTVHPLASTSSSVYSESVVSPVNSPANSVIHLPCSSIAELPEHIPSYSSGNIVALLPSPEVRNLQPNENSTFLDHESRSSNLGSTKTVTLPTNVSSSNLSKGSKSSKTSRFKEDFDTVDMNRSTKRSSFVNLFTKSKPKHDNDDIPTLDGSREEPGRLQRATPLIKRHDAADLFSKAIKAQQAEKSSMYLSANKDRAEFEMIRKRSTSFSHQPSVPARRELASDGMLSPGSQIVANGPKSGERSLTPGFPLPDFASSTQDTFKRKQSGFGLLNRLKPEFSLPIFSSSADLQTASLPTRTRSSVPLDPMEKPTLALGSSIAISHDHSEIVTDIFSHDEQKKAWDDIDAILPVRPVGHSLTVLEYLAAFKKENSWTPEGSEPALQRLSETLAVVLNIQVQPSFHVKYDTSFSVEQLLYAFVALQTDHGSPQFPDEMFQSSPRVSFSPAPGMPKVPSFELNDRPVLMDPPPQSPGIPRPISQSSHYINPVLKAVDDREKDLGSWSRYPSHTRSKRTGSAGQADQVKTYDFAYHVNPLNIVTGSSSADDTTRKEKSRKKKSKGKARTGLPKSKSMMIGKDFIKNYARLVRSPSVEWLSHGKGHRSSISAGGALDHPELEVLPPVFAAYPRPIPESREEDAALADFLVHKNTFEMQDIQPQQLTDLYPRLDGSTELNGGGEQDGLLSGHDKHAIKSSDLLVQNSNKLDSEDRALTWSRHYASCVAVPNKSSDGPDSEFTGTSTVVSTTTAANLIDAMLASTSGTNSGFGSENSGSMPARNGRHEKMASATSIRASSMDLLKKLAEAEEREKMRCFQLFMNDKRAAEEGEFLARKSLAGPCVSDEAMPTQGGDSSDDVWSGGPAQQCGDVEVIDMDNPLVAPAA